MFIKKNCYIFLVLIFTLCLSLSFSVGAEDQGNFGGTLTWGISAAPPTLDIQWTTITASGNIGRNIWEGLVIFDANGAIQPELAKEWNVSDDELTWTFYLRENVLFHNGKEMTSEDVVASARRWVEVCPTKLALKSIDSIDAIDKYTVEFKLNKKFGGLITLMANLGGRLVIMPKEVCEGVPGGKLKEYIGTGPYKFEEWKLDQYIKLVKFQDYHDQIKSEPSGYAGKKNAYVDEIIVKFVPETSTLLAGLETGEFDMIEPIQSMEVDRLKGIKEINLKRYVKWYLNTVFNTKGVFKNQKLRQAAVMALDMEEIMLSVGKKRENIYLVSSPFHKSSIWYTGQLEKYYNQKNPEGAKKLMQEAGYNGEEIILLTTKHYPWAFDMAIPIEDQLSKIGFNIKMEVVDWPTLVSRRAEFEGWDMFTSAFNPLDDPIRQNEMFMGNYPGWYTSPEIQEQLRIITQETDFEKRYNAWAKVEALLGQNPAAINPGQICEFRGARSNIKGDGFFSDYRYAVLWNVYKEE